MIRAHATALATTIVVLSSALAAPGAARAEDAETAAKRRNPEQKNGDC
jgi:hypothetical protein